MDWRAVRKLAHSGCIDGCMPELARVQQTRRQHGASDGVRHTGRPERNCPVNKKKETNKQRKAERTNEKKEESS